ncbi:MAG: MarR family transcriptional regulator [Gemmatimonadales bacterium]|nr:MAG: MarR family transcriptional regulator [Gemmatimonadales bacterium]
MAGHSSPSGNGRDAYGIVRGDRPDDAPAWLIQRASRTLRVLFLRLMESRASGITPEMWLVLSRLYARDGQYQTQIADGTFRDRPNTSRILSGLEARGYVRREKDADDMRRVRIFLTHQGKEFVQDIAPVAAKTRDTLYEGLTDEELRVLRRALRRIERNALSELESVGD